MQLQKTMASNPQANQPEMEQWHIQPVFTTSELSQLHLYSLILSAAGIRHKIVHQAAPGWEIHVFPSEHAHALAEIHAYDNENRNWPLQPAESDSFRPLFRAQSLLVIFSLLLFHAVTGPWSPQSLWFTNGAVNSSAILADREYFRLLTALTLHADLVHLLGNCFIGGFLLHFYFLILGNGIGLSVLILSAILANFVNVLAHGPGHLSVGFSTAVFSVIGILSALNYRHYKFTRPARLVLPFMAGAAMLAMLGSSGERTDLGAHFFGLITGLVAGSLLGIDAFFKLRYNSWLQFFLTITSLALPVLAWRIAMH